MIIYKKMKENGSKHYERWFYSEIGRRLKSARIAMGMTQQAVADLLEINRVAYAEIEAGRQRLALLNLRRVAFILAEDIEAFIPTKREYLQAKASINFVQ